MARGVRNELFPCGPERRTFYGIGSENSAIDSAISHSRVHVGGVSPVMGFPIFCIRPPNAQPSRVRAYITSASRRTWFGIRQRCTCYKLVWTPLSSPFGSVMRASRQLTDTSRRTLQCWRTHSASWPLQDLLRVVSSRTTNSWRFWLPYDYGEPAEI